MPFYEYQCDNCGHDLEVMQKVSDPRLKKCPECGKSSLKRLMSAPVFRLKGSGWYETDFKSDQDNKRNLADKAEPDAPKDDKKDATKAEKKADASTEAATPAKEAKPAADKPASASSASVKTAKAAKSSGRKAAVSRKKPAAKAKSRRR